MGKKTIHTATGRTLDALSMEAVLKQQLTADDFRISDIGPDTDTWYVAELAAVTWNSQAKFDDVRITAGNDLRVANPGHTRGHAHLEMAQVDRMQRNPERFEQRHTVTCDGGRDRDQ